MDLEKRIFAAPAEDFTELAIELFNYQYRENTVYRQYCDAIKTDPVTVDSIKKIPYLPISFFKTHAVKTGDFETGIVFESSGTTGSTSSKHYVKDIELYRESFTACFASLSCRPSLCLSVHRPPTWWVQK